MDAVKQLRDAGFDETQAAAMVEVMGAEIERIENLERKRFKKRWKEFTWTWLTATAYLSLLLLMLVGFFASIGWILKP